MKTRALAVLCALLALSGCGAATNVGSGPTTIPLFDTTEVADLDDAATESIDSTTSTLDTTASSTSDPLMPTTTDAASSTSADDTPTTEAPNVNAAFCTPYVEFAASDAQVPPNDPDGTAALVAAQEATWIELTPLAPAAISSDVAIVRDFTTALRQLLADNGNDLGAVFAEAIQLEVDLEAEPARFVVEHFGMLTCGAEAKTPEEETAVFYASLLDTAERRTVLADLLATDGLFDLGGANCFVERAEPEMMFPLTGASSTPTEDAALGQALDGCQLSI